MLIYNFTNICTHHTHKINYSHRLTHIFNFQNNKKNEKINELKYEMKDQKEKKNENKN